MTRSPRRTPKITLEMLNFQHLLYFWKVAHTGTVTQAAKELHLTSPTVSAQIRKLENLLGHELFRPYGRRLQLTDAGRLLMQYADRIFTLGGEMLGALTDGQVQGELLLRVGVVDVIPKLAVHRLLSQLRTQDNRLRLHCTEGRSEEMIHRLFLHEVDVLLSDAPVPEGPKFRFYNHLVQKSTISFFATRKLLNSIGVPFDESKSLRESLALYPLLLPTRETQLRRRLEQYFDAHQIPLTTVHEFADTAMMKVFGEAGWGIFPGPTAIADAICDQYRVICLGECPTVTESIYAVTTQRQIEHPAVVQLTSIRGQSAPKPSP